MMESELHGSYAEQVIAAARLDLVREQGRASGLESLARDMLYALDSCRLQMQIAGLGYATTALDAQIARFSDALEGLTRDGAVEGM